MQCSTTQQNDNFGLDKFDLPVQIPDTGGGFIFARHPVPRGATFNNVGYINFFALQMHGVDHFIQQLPGGANKGAPGGIFICSRAFTDKHQSGIGRTFAENHVLTGAAQGAIPAIQYHIAQTIPIAGYFANLRNPECRSFCSLHCDRRRHGMRCRSGRFCGTYRRWRRSKILPCRRNRFHGSADAAGKFLPLFRRYSYTAFGSVRGDGGGQIIKKIHINHPFSDNITLFRCGASQMSKKILA